MRAALSDLRIILLADEAEQNRCTFGEWCFDNDGAFSEEEIEGFYAALRRKGEVKINLGAGGIITLRIDHTRKAAA